MEQGDLFKWRPPPQKYKKPPPFEWKLVPLRECAHVIGRPACEKPEIAAEYWRNNIATVPSFNPDCESFAVLILNVRLRIKGHQVVSTGLLDQVPVHAREVFRAAVVAAAYAVVLMHNHPSGDPTPSDADLRVTRELIQVGRILRIEVLDHVIMGYSGFVSLRAFGLFQP